MLRDREKSILTNISGKRENVQSNEEGGVNKKKNDFKNVFQVPIGVYG
jgi:hypothetical protein